MPAGPNPDQLGHLLIDFSCGILAGSTPTQTRSNPFFASSPTVSCARVYRGGRDFDGDGRSGCRRFDFRRDLSLSGRSATAGWLPAAAALLAVCLIGSTAVDIPRLRPAVPPGGRPADRSCSDPRRSAGARVRHVAALLEFALLQATGLIPGQRDPSQRRAQRGGHDQGGDDGHDHNQREERVAQHAHAQAQCRDDHLGGSARVRAATHRGRFAPGEPPTRPPANAGANFPSVATRTTIRAQPRIDPFRSSPKSVPSPARPKKTGMNSAVIRPRNSLSMCEVNMGDRPMSIPATNAPERCGGPSHRSSAQTHPGSEG